MSKRKKAWGMSNPLYRYLHRKTRRHGVKVKTMVKHRRKSGRRGHRRGQASMGSTSNLIMTGGIGAVIGGVTSTQASKIPYINTLGTNANAVAGGLGGLIAGLALKKNLLVSTIGGLIGSQVAPMIVKPVSTSSTGLKTW